MERLLSIVFLSGFLLVLAQSHGFAACGTSTCPGQPCTLVGESKISDDHANIIFCGKNLAAPAPELIWKSTVADMQCPAGQIVTSVVNGVAKCMEASQLVNIRACDPESQQLLSSVVNGVTVCDGPTTYYWSAWSACSVACGGGTQTRKCYGTDGTTNNSKWKCGGGALSRACNSQACPAPILSTATGTECISGGAAGCPGQPCQEEQFGTTQMSDDQANIIACLRNTVTASPEYVWKSTVADFACPAGQIIRDINNGVPTCVDAVPQMLPGDAICRAGMLIGFNEGGPVCIFW